MSLHFDLKVLFQKNHYITIDFQNCTLEKYKVYNNISTSKEQNLVAELNGKEKKYIYYSNPIIHKHNALKEELTHFIYSINNNKQPKTDGYSALKALKVALNIQKIIDQKSHS